MTHIMEYTQLKQNAKKLIAAQNWNAALQILLKMKDITPNNFMLLIKFGNVYESLNNPSAAEYYYKTAIQISPNKMLGHFSLAKVLMHLKDYAAAEQCLKECIILRPNMAVTHTTYAQLLYKMHRYDTALYHCMRAADIKPEISNYHFYAAKMALLVNTERADDTANYFFKHAIELTNQTEMTYVNEYVLHWRRWPMSFNCLSATETLHYLYKNATTKPTKADSIRLRNDSRREHRNLCLYCIKHSYFRNCAEAMVSIDRCIELDPNNNETFDFERYKCTDMLKYGNMSVFSKGVRGHRIHTQMSAAQFVDRRMVNIPKKPNFWQSYAGNYRQWRLYNSQRFEEKTEEKMDWFRVTEIMETDFKLIVSAYVSHLHLGIDSRVIIPNEIEHLCLNYLLDTQYILSLRSIDEFSAENKLDLHSAFKKECLEILFDSVCHTTHKRVTGAIIKVLDCLEVLCTDAYNSECMVRHRHTYYRGIFPSQFDMRYRCNCRHNRVLCAYYITYLRSLLCVSDMHRELLTFVNGKVIAFEYVEKLVLLPFKLILLSHTGQSRNMRVAFDFLTQLIARNETFSEIYYGLVFYQRKLSKHKILAKVCALLNDSHKASELSLDTMRFVVAPLLFRPTKQRPKWTVGVANIRLLEALICNGLEQSYRTKNNKYQIAFTWLAYEMSAIAMGDSDFHFELNFDAILTEMWMYLMRKVEISAMDCHVLKTFINCGVCLKPKHMSWPTFLDVIQSRFTGMIKGSVEFVEIMTYYCYCRMSKDRENEQDWAHCISILTAPHNRYGIDLDF